MERSLRLLEAALRHSNHTQKLSSFLFICFNHCSAKKNLPNISVTSANLLQLNTETFLQGFKTYYLYCCNNY